MKTYLFTSERLGFRTWLDSDIGPFSEMNASREVMEFFPKVSTRKETEEQVGRIKAGFEEYGYCFYAVDRLDNNEFIGFIGLTKPRFDAYFTPCVEIGWRIKKEEWNKGYATEGAKRCLEYAAEHLKLHDIYSFTATLNTRSEKVMQKIGMEKVGEFEHPKIEAGHKLSTHLLYKITLDLNKDSAQ